MPLLLRVLGVDASLFGPPRAHHVDALCAAQRRAPRRRQRYAASLTASPRGFHINHLRARIAPRAHAYRRAVAALRSAALFHLPWLRVWRRGASDWAPGDVLVIAARLLPGVWAINVNSVVLVRQHAASMHVAWATTARHVLRGEESIVLRALHDHVHFELRSFSKPNCCAARLATPLIRVLQRKFAIDVYTHLNQIAHRHHHHH